MLVATHTCRINTPGTHYNDYQDLKDQSMKSKVRIKITKFLYFDFTSLQIFSVREIYQETFQEFSFHLVLFFQERKIILVTLYYLHIYIF